MILTGQQIKILREGTIAAYSREELGILLEEEMGVSFDTMARGSNYNVQVSNLIQDFVAAGRIEEFIRVIVKTKPKSPYLEPIIKFADIVQDGQGQPQVPTATAWLQHTGTSTVYPLSETEKILIGRSLDCQIILNSALDSSISRHHAQLRPLAGSNRWEICDLESENGTYVNGKPLRGCQTLQNGDRLTFGQSPAELIFTGTIPPNSVPDLPDYQGEEQPWYAPNLPETREITSQEAEAWQDKIEVAIVTATEVELKAVTRYLKPLPRKRKVSLVYWGPETYYLGKFGAFPAVVTKCRMGAIGEGSVILATDQAQRLWQPKAIIMVGIAFGKDPQKQKIADVLVASQIIPYETQRIGDEIIYRSSIPPSNTTLLNRFENVQNWQFLRPDGSPCQLLVGPILSGEKLIDNLEFKTKLFQDFPQAIGGEMEGAGLCAASGRMGRAWILVKSICDWADGQKQGKHQPLAAAAAASLVHYVLGQPTVLAGLPKI